MQIAVLSDDTRTVEAAMSGDRVVVAVDDLVSAIGWQLKPEGLCRDDVCVPVRDRAAIEADGGVDLVAIASALGRPAVASIESGVVAIGEPAASRRSAIADMQAVPFTLPDLDGQPHSLSEWRGRKKLLHVFASW
jgi:hypothetical protein